MVIPGHNLGNSQVSVNRTIGPTLVKFMNAVERVNQVSTDDFFPFRFLVQLFDTIGIAWCRTTFYLSSHRFCFFIHVVLNGDVFSLPCCFILTDQPFKCFNLLRKTRLSPSH